MRISILPALTLLAACGGADDGAQPDAAVGGDVDAAACATSLDPLDDGTDLSTDLIISEINPGEYIEVFNTTDHAIDLATGEYADYQWCSPFEYSPLPPTVTVPAGGYALLEWPVNFTNSTDAGGQLLLFRNDLFDVGAHIIDFVCWGNSVDGRKEEAEGVGKWSGDCAPAIPANGAIHRRPATAGTVAADYDPAAPPSPMSCAAGG